MKHFNPNCTEASFYETSSLLVLRRGPAFKLKGKAYRFLLIMLLAVTGFCLAPIESKASWWSDNVGAFFKASYNSSTGTIHIEAFAVNAYYFSTGIGDNWSILKCQTATVSFSQDGTNYNEFYKFGFNWDGTEDYAGSVNGYTVTHYNSVPDGKNRIMFMDLQLTDAIRNIKNIKINVHLDGGGTHESDNNEDTRSVTVTQMSDINTTAVQFVTVDSEAKATFGYTKTTLNDIDNVSQMQLYNADKNHSRFYNVGKNASDFVDLSKSDSSYYYMQSAYNGRITHFSAYIYVSAFTLPKTATAVYDASTHNVKFNWTIDPVSTDKVVKDKFIIQIADNEKFTEATEIKIDYDPVQSSYSLNTSDYKTVTLTKNMYFRVGRGDVSVSKTDWNIWAVAKTTQLEIPFISLNANKVSLELKGNDTALIRWDPIPTAWITGASFIITKINKTSRSQTEIKLSKDDYETGSYIDKQISICNEYTYTLQVIPPDDAGFTAFAPVQIANTILPTQIGTIFNLTVSKGYFPDRTELKWSSEGVFDNFIVKRAEYNSDRYVQLTTIPGSSTSDYQTDDSRGVPGTYYKYMIVGMVNCNNKPAYSKDTLYAIGFRSPTGNIYGRVTYENGQAVAGAAVRLESQDNVQLGQSIYLDGSSESYLRLDTLNTQFEDSALTVEAWIKPDDALPRNQVIFSRAGQYELGFNGTGQLYFSYNGKTVTGAYANQGQSFIHITGIHSKAALELVVNDKLIARIPNQFQEANNKADSVYIGYNPAGDNFKGYMDEMRIWNIALSDSQVVHDYTRMIAGDERGLAAYWRFDETIKDQFYDASHKNDQYNQNDGVISGNVKHSDTTPSSGQLSLKAYTDSTVNYMISGVPFTGNNGTTYKIAPLFGAHVFDPVSVTRLVSASSTSFTVDFKDKSSFDVSGYVLYRNSSVPVKGVQFKIDGVYAQESNGKLKETDGDGKFTISVPVGIHEVKAVKANHVFVNDGKITDSHLENFNYQGPKNDRYLSDSTTVRLIGRVAGGAVQEAYPLGHSLSKNNLGEGLTVSLQLAGGDPTKWKINSGSADSLTTVYHLLPSNQTDTAKTHRTKGDFQPYNVLIYPDVVTCEFAADVIPENFSVFSVTATGHGDLMKNTNESLDLTNAFQQQKVVYSYKDSTSTTDGNWNYTNYSDTVFYNASYQKIERQNPTISVVQVNMAGKELSYFGDSLCTVTPLIGDKLQIPVYNGKKYLFNYPVFSQNNQYQFSIKAYEVYNYYKTSDPKTSVSVDWVPTQDGLVSVINALRPGTNEADTFSLDKQGSGIYKFLAGEPEISDGVGRKGFSVSIKIGSQTIPWNAGNTQEGYIMGYHNTGNDFTTTGPTEIVQVLRDPPGSNSYAYFQKGVTTTTENEYVGTVSNSGSEQMDAYLGTKVVTWAGVGAGTIQEMDVENTIGGKVSHEETYTGTNKTTTVTTFNTRFQTSSDPGYVGAEGDLFIGHSTNITFGNSLNLTVVKNSEVNPGADVVFFDGIKNRKNYSIITRTGFNIQPKYGTYFAFPQSQIENELIPKWKAFRNSILLPNTTDTAMAHQKAISTGKVVYVSKIPSSDSLRYGATNGNVDVLGISAKDEAWNNGSSYIVYLPYPGFKTSDTIMILNQYIKDWQDALKMNEKTKVEATNQLENYSFTGGSNVEYSGQYNDVKTYQKNFNIIVGGSFLTTAGATFSNTGVRITIDENVSTQQGGNFSTTTDNSNLYGFVLAETGSDYISVDVDTAPDSSFVFKAKGGVTSCPYEGATLTKYYQKGTIIDQPTVQSEDPAITVDKPVVAGIPSNRQATYNVHMHNAADAKGDVYFGLNVIDKSNPNGAKIYMNATELGTGRNILVPSGETLTKTITLERGPDSMNYDNIQLSLHSTCQNDIASIINISAHFIPSCSDIHIKSPMDKWVLNTLSKENDDKDAYLPISMDQFDINHSLFDHIELQYKPASGATWTKVMQFYGDSAKMKAAQGPKQMITDNGQIDYNLIMDNGLFSDQQYDIQAVSVCMDNGQVISTTPSNMISGIKDTYTPRLFGSPQPANGILGVGDDIRLNFNETIAAGLLNHIDNFMVTGIRNGAKGDHSVSVRLDGQSNYLESEFDKNLTGKDITAEMWVLPDKVENVTLFSQGNANESMELAFTADNLLEVIMGKRVIKSDKPFDYKKGEWAHVALVYDAAASKVSAFYNFEEVISAVSVDKYTGIGHFEFGRSISKNGNFFAGKMHEARVWSNDKTGIMLQENSLTRLSGGENGLLAYYPMNEGKGNVAFDKAHASNARLTGNWSTPAGKGLQLEGNGYIKINTAYAPITSTMDYTIGVWFKGAAGQTDVTLASNGKGDGTDVGGSLNLFSLGFEGGLLTYRNNGFKIQASGNYLDNNWHHVAIAVNRNSGNAQFFVDGQLNKFFDAKNLGGIEAAFTYLGARVWQNADSGTVTTYDRYYKGSIDEFRIWNTYLNQTLINKNNNVRLNGDEMGLLAYYPFEKYIEFQNNKELDSTLADMKIQLDPNVQVPDAEAVNATLNDKKAPVIDRGPVENLQFDYVVNNDALIINMLEPKQTIDKTIVTLQAKEIRDMNGNSTASPITWTAYIDQNQLKWGDQELNLEKEVYAPMQFESYIVNNGGSIQHFRLDNLPSWLKAIPESGTIDPEGKQKIIFTVDEGLNVGTYDEIIYMLNDNDESEALTLNLKVKGKEPDLTVNPADYKYNMAVYGKIRIANVFSNDKDDKLAAFIDGKCVGVTNNTYFADNDLWYAFLTVYSNSLQLDKLEFRIWDASTGKVYYGMPSVPVAFANDAIIGTARNPVIFDGKEMLFQNITLNKNWNWISFNVSSPGLSNINTTLSNGQWQSGNIVKNEELGFDQYSSHAEWVGYLKGFNNTSLFMLNTANAQTLSINGTVVDVTKTPITVKGSRWSYISYLPQVNMKVKDALAGYEASDEDVIKSQSGFAMYDSQNGWVGNLTYLEPGKGYMFYRKATSDTTFVYPNLSGSLTNGGRFMNGIADNRTGKVNDLETPVSGNFNFAENMTVAAIIGNEFQLRKGDNVLAYVNGELRSRSQWVPNAVINKETFFLNIAGAHNQPVYFMIERNSEIIAESTTAISYQPNSIIGTVSKPLVIHVRKVLQGVAIYPNPFNDQVNISVNLTNDGVIAGTHEIQVSVYNVAGQLIVNRSKEQINNGVYQTTWNGKRANGAECPAGIYFINIKIDGVLKIYKVIKG